MTTETLSFANVNIGDKLDSKELPITSGLVVGGALASRDFTAVHHDKKAAQAAGLPDVFMNILTSNGLMASYVTNWAGPDATVKKIDLKLGAPNLPGFVMTLVGEIKAKDDANGIIDVEVVGENNVWGMHMAGTVKIQLPQ
ncbi:MaoC dehydratase-like protein [Sinobacterium caligoides]|uniref:MaoC dehydratase-like protein n=1 Tax=Sinobacterium caligoides TaxID=933926 RepID=A0A3N2DQ48_9GAMM|nr:MaoC/PaaZ C-terminal domain-containing protein [Sinobacterium caligoides]ROS01910.1 MaoC dehydratase-like protein [Sinobacterium caligoides]